MLKSYFGFIKSVFINITSGNHEALSLADYFKAIGFGITTVLLIVLFIALIIGLFVTPAKGFGVFAKKELAAARELAKSEAFSAEKAREVNEAISKKRFIYALFLIVIYIPVAIPTLLFVIDQVLGLIA